MANRFIKYILASTFFVGLILLLLSVIRSGYFYIIDYDELIHSQFAYLIAKGYKPYLLIHSVFSPLFHWFLIPILSLAKFSFISLNYARIVMIGIFLIRILLIYVIVKAVFNRITGLLFIILYLLDPFTVFSAMQIRPDNLMLLLYTAGLLIFTFSLIKHSESGIFFSGLLMACSFLVLVKIVPSILSVFVVYFAFCITSKHPNKILNLILGFFLPCLIFFCYFFIQETLPLMFQQMIIDAKNLNNSILNPVPLGFFYQPNNSYIYGLGGRPLNWVYARILPVLGMIGFIIVFSDIIKSIKKLSPIIWVKILLCLSFISQGVTLLFLHSIFIQYYLPVNWLMAIFAAAAIYQILFKINFFPVKIVVSFLVIIFLLAVIYVSIQANNERVKIDFLPNKLLLESRWKIIPRNEAVFPNLTFRPVAHSLLFSAFIGDFPQSIVKSYPPIITALERNQVRYLILDDYYLKFLDQATLDYINNNYNRLPVDNEIWIRR